MDVYLKAYLIQILKNQSKILTYLESFQNIEENDYEIVIENQKEIADMKFEVFEIEINNYIYLNKN